MSDVTGASFTALIVKVNVLISVYSLLIIIVGVALDTLQQIESHMLMRNYDGFLKSGRIRGRSRRY